MFQRACLSYEQFAACEGGGSQPPLEKERQAMKQFESRNELHGAKVTHRSYDLLVRYSDILAFIRKAATAQVRQP